MEIRDARGEDLPAIESVVASAFTDDGAHVVAALKALADSGALRASLIALDGDHVIGHVALSRGWIDAREQLVEALVLSPLSVVPAHQRRGVGTRLVGAALVWAEHRGAPAVFLEGDWNYYGSRGFTAGGDHGFRAPSDRIPGRAFQVALLPTSEPWMRGQLIYPEAFWATDAVGLRDPRLTTVERRSADAVDID